MDDLIGKKFTKLTILEISKIKKNGKYVAKVKCDCGKEKNIRLDSVTSNNVRSCGCMRREVISAGEKYGSLTVMKFVGVDRVGRSLWLFQCECSNVVERVAAKIKCDKNGALKHCGCKRLTDDAALMKTLYQKYRDAALVRDIGFELTIEEFTKLVNEDCDYCGTEPTNTFSRRGRKNTIYYNGIDRVNNFESYSASNSVACCKVCNVAKATYTHEFFKEWIKKTYLHMKQKGEIE